MYIILINGLGLTFPKRCWNNLNNIFDDRVSNAAGEKAFSVLKRVKNYQLNSIKQDHRKELAILCIENDLT